MHCGANLSKQCIALHEGEKSSTHLIFGASAVRVVPRPEDRTQLLSSSLRSFSGPTQLLPFCGEMLGRVWERGCISLARLPQHSTSSTPCFLFCPGRTQPVFFLLCCFDSAASCHVQFYVSQLSSSSVVCGVLRGSLRKHDCSTSTTPEAHFKRLGTWL